MDSIFSDFHGDNRRVSIYHRRRPSGFEKAGSKWLYPFICARYYCSMHTNHSNQFSFCQKTTFMVLREEVGGTTRERESAIAVSQLTTTRARVTLDTSCYRGLW